jgi:hypothetical protein
LFPPPSQPGWDWDFLNDKYEVVIDVSTGQKILVDKTKPKYKLDA